MSSFQALVGLTLLLALLPTSAKAEIPSVLVGRTISSVEITGEMAGLIDSESLGLEIGQPLSRDLLREATQRLLETGDWVNVQIRVAGQSGRVRVMVDLTPRLLIERYEIRGRGTLDRQDIARVMQLRNGAELELRHLEAGRRRLLQLYAEDGYPEAEVEWSIRDTDSPARKVIVVTVLPGRPTRIRSLNVLGGRRLDPRVIRRAIGLSPGDIFDQDGLREGIRQAEILLREQGYLRAQFDRPTVDTRDDGVHIVLTLRLGPEVRIRIRGESPLNAGDIRDALNLSEEPLPRGTQFASLNRRIVDLYTRHGFDESTRSEIRLTPINESGIAELRIQIQPGELRDVREIVFPGSQFFEADFLREQITSYLDEDLPGGGPLYPVDSDTMDRIGFGASPTPQRQRTRPIHLDPRRVYYPSTYEEATRHIQELYQAQGFLDARVGPAELIRLRADAYRVMIPIEEGERRLLHEVRIQGNLSVPTFELFEAIELRRGEAYSALAIEEARRSILEVYREAGYLFAEIEANVTFSSDRTRALVTLVCREGVLVYVGEILIRGAEHTRDSLIRRTLPLSPGELYRPSQARAGEDRLMALGIFTSVTIAPQDPTTRSDTKNVVVTVIERPSQSLGFSVGLSTGEGFRGGFEYGYRNLFGYGIGLALRAQGAQQLFFLDGTVADRYRDLSLADRLERRVTAAITIPRLAQLQTSLDLTHLRENERDFGLDANRVALSFGYQPHRRIALSLIQTLENNDVTILGEDDYAAILERADPRLQEILRVPQGETTLVATRFDLTLDFRNSPFNTTRGAFLALSSEYARTLSSERVDIGTMEDEFFSHQIRLSFTANGYIPLGRRFVLALQARFGRVFHVDPNSETYPDRQFFLGGVDSLRAFNKDGLLPQDVADSLRNTPDFVAGVLRGGDAFVLARAELRFPLTSTIGGGVFVDAGNVWTDASALEPLRLRPTVGLGIRIATPIGPLAFDYGFNALPRPELNEPFGTFHFSIGLF